MAPGPQLLCLVGCPPAAVDESVAAAYAVIAFGSYGGLACTLCKKAERALLASKGG